jgi:hypothetical protein
MPPLHFNPNFFPTAMKKDFQFKTLLGRVFSICCLLFISQSVFAQVSGTVFRDFNSNGVKDDQHELGVKGIIVTAYDVSGVQYGPATSAADGTYTVGGIPAGKEVRLQFAIPATVGCFNEKVSSSFGIGTSGASSSSTSIQFVKGGVTNANFAINNPVDYSQANPKVAIPCYAQGDIRVKAGATIINSVDVGARDRDVLVTFNYKDNSTPTNTPVPLGGSSSSPKPNHLAIVKQMGSVWGLAYQKESKKLFTSALMRRSAHFGPLGTGGIYVVDNSPTAVLDTNKSLNFVDVQTIGINTGANPHVPGVMAPRDVVMCDAVSFPQVGKVGIGDIDLSDDGKNLYLTNLNDRKLYKIFVNNPAVVPIAANVKAYNDCPWLAITYAKGIARPFATKFYRDKLYVGVVYTEEIGGVAANLEAKIYELDTKTDTWTVAPYLTIPLNYTKGISVAVTATTISSDKKWNPWKDFITQPTGVDATASTLNLAYPQPMLSDIEFDTDGSVIIGLMDRTGHQTGSGTLLFNSSGACIVDAARGYGPFVVGNSGGDILRAARDINTCALQLESNGKAGTRTSLTGVGNGEGIGGGEFYAGDKLLPKDLHQENFVGGLALKAGSNRTLGAVFDPFGLVSGGVTYFDNTNGEGDKRYEAFPPNNSPNGPGKGAGIGDVELLLDNAPIQIGNRIWIDKDKDGFQDPEEKTLGGVTVNLYNSSNVLVASTITLADGTYAFDTLNKVGGKLAPYTNYEIRVAKTAVADYLTITNVNSGTNDAIDSDAFLVGSNYVIPVTTGNFGESDHTFDIGFKCIQLDAGQDQTFCQMTPATYQLPAALSNQTWVKLSGTSTINASTGAVTGLTAGTHEFILKYTATTDCADTVKFVVNIVPDLAISSTVATCPASGGNANNDAKINLITTTNGVKVDYTSGSTYTGTKSYASLSTGMPSGNVFTVPNPSVTKNFTVRLYNNGGTCFIDKTIEIKHKDCPIICPPITCLPETSVKN